jgi:monoamine oxidase
MAESGYANTVGGTLQKIGFARMCQCERNWNDDGEGDFRVEGTLEETAVTALASGLTIHKACPVTQITRNGQGVEVRVAGGRSLSAAAVVVTAPVPTLQRRIINFQPPLPASKIRALASMECEPGVKLLAKFSSLIWPENLHGMICSDAFAPELWFDKHVSTSPDGTPGPTLYYMTAFFTSDQARRVSAMPTAEAFAALLNQLDEMFQVTFPVSSLLLFLLRSSLQN